MHRQAITTRYLGATNHRGARIKASAAVGSKIISWDHALNSSGNHIAAAKALAEHFGWNGYWVSGGAPDERGDVFVLAASRWEYPIAELTDMEAAFVVEPNA